LCKYLGGEKGRDGFGYDKDILLLLFLLLLLLFVKLLLLEELLENVLLNGLLFEKEVEKKSLFESEKFECINLLPLLEKKGKFILLLFPFPFFSLIDDDKNNGENLLEHESNVSSGMKFLSVKERIS
jgi:hypothetical protein